MKRNCYLTYSNKRGYKGKEYCKQLCANIVDNLGETNKFSKRQTTEMDLSRKRRYE